MKIWKYQVKNVQNFSIILPNIHDLAKVKKFQINLKSSSVSQETL